MALDLGPFLVFVALGFTVALGLPFLLVDTVGVFEGSNFGAETPLVDLFAGRGEEECEMGSML